MARVTPQILRGTRDFLPERMLLRRWVTDTMRRNFERFGFEPLETPALEYAETLEGKFGAEGEKLIYKFQDHGGRRVALRYDLTVPLARLVAMYPELPKPFKRYQIAPVWRAERPQKGRYREFWQCDADTVGTSSMLADAELICLVTTVLKELGFAGFVTKISHRQILSALAEQAGVPEAKAAFIYRAIDKLDKIGREGVLKELEEQGLPREAATRLIEMTSTAGEASSLLGQVREQLADHPARAASVQQLQSLFDHLAAMDVPSSAYQLDLSLARGMDYYTGPIFETVVHEPKIGSICGGGRYDKLIGLFAARDEPATGVSFGLERIIDVIQELHLAQGVHSTVAQVLVTLFSPDAVAASLRLATQLRQAQLSVEVYPAPERLGVQLRYATRKGIPLAIILGPDELATGTAVVKNLLRDEQQAVSHGEIVRYVKTLVEAASTTLGSESSFPQKDTPPA